MGTKWLARGHGAALFTLCVCDRIKWRVRYHQAATIIVRVTVYHVECLRERVFTQGGALIILTPPLCNQP